MRFHTAFAAARRGTSTNLLRLEQAVCASCVGPCLTLASCMAAWQSLGARKETWHGGVGGALPPRGVCAPKKGPCRRAEQPRAAELPEEVALHPST